MIKQYAYKFQIRSNNEQVRKMSQFAGCNRLVWNKALVLQKERLDNKETIFKYTELARMLVEWKQEQIFLSDVPSQSLQQTLKQLDRALWDAFNKKNPKKFPRFKKKGLKDSFLYPQGHKLDQQNSRVYLPKIGWVRYRKSRAVEGTIKNVTVSKKCNKWYVSIQAEIEVLEIKHSSKSIVGVDVGVSKLATCSDGRIFQPVNSFKKHRRKLAFLQKSLARKKKFSNNRKKLKQKISKLHSKIANTRNDYLHKTSCEISNNHAVVVLENLKVSNMSKSVSGSIEKPGNNVKANSGLNRSILNQGWYELRRQLEYKLNWKGGHLILVDPKYTSQKCSSCGYIHSGNRISQAKFECKNCTHKENVDINAAKNILAAGHAVFACGGYDVGQPMKQEPAEKAYRQLFA